MILGEMAGSPVEATAGLSGGSSDVGASSSIPIEESGNGGAAGGGGSRWPRQQTLALLKIRSDMDPAFKDASLKAPLWEEVSRKMAELGFQRSAKKCREKFENVYKYHKRTKDGRSSKPDGKAYRFFDQLEALENNPNSFTFPLPSTATANDLQLPSYKPAASLPTSPTPLSVLPPNLGSNPGLFQQQQQQPSSHFTQLSASFLETSSSSTSSDEDIQQRRRGKKRKWKDYLQRLMKDVISKQEELQKRFLEALEKGERDRIAREEAWRVEEMARKKREHDLLVQERSMSAAKDAAVVAFLQKITTCADPNFKLPQLPSIQPHHPMLQQQLQPVVVQDPTRDHEVGIIGTSNLGSSSRWPKAEVLALINLRKNMDLKYQDNGPKGPLWEDVSGAMAKLGYNRSSKRCKEKWENINKYYKKVKESNKKRPEDSKTCPYFHQLEALYRDKVQAPPANYSNSTVAPPNPVHETGMHDIVMGMNDNNNSHLTEDEEDDEEEEYEDVEEEDGGGFEMIPPSTTVE